MAQKQKKKQKQPKYCPHFANLPAYKKTIDLDEQFTQSTSKVPREIKYTRLADLRNKILDIMVNIAYADEDEAQRIYYITEATKLLKRLQFEVRILYDIHTIRPEGLDAIIREEGYLEAQLKGWLNSTIEKQNK